MNTHPIMSEIMAANALARGGDRTGARAKFDAVWSRFADDPDPVLECVLAHHMADAQDDPAEELAWDIRALDAALRCTDADAQRHQPAVSIAGFMPSLHTNLAEDYFKLGDSARSREHLASARSFAGNLAHDPYGHMIRGGMERLAKKLDAQANGSGVQPT